MPSPLGRTTASAADTPRLRRAVRPATVGSADRRAAHSPSEYEPRLHRRGGLPNYYRENVIGGPGAFVMQIVNFDTFAEAITNKLLTEISDASPHSLHAAVPVREWR
jgi:hypothetical protein